jgi:UDP-D-galactose:(glucosyl)LPS alpha-1,6-D-galactosyltransferase
VDGVLATSTGIKEFFSRLIPEEKIHVIFNPVEKQGANLARPANTPKFIYVGRLTDFDKNISFLLRSLSRLKDEIWSLDIFGAGPDQNKLKNLSSKLGLENKIRWIGFYSEPFSLVQECTALLLTSRFEGFGLVLVEANAHGIPVISSNCLAGPEDIVIEGVNGYLFPEGDLEAFVNILRKVIRGELNFASPGEIARTAERFSPEAFYERLKSALEL